MSNPLNPLWRKTPWVLLRFPQVLGAVGLSFLILGMAAASTPLFLASSGTAALATELQGKNRWLAGLRVTQENFGDFDAALQRNERRTRLLDDAMAPFENVDEGIVTATAGVLTLGAEGSRGATDEGLLLTRTNAFQHLTRLTQGAAKDGLWLADVTAKELGAEPGDALHVRAGNREVTAPVAGIYRALVLDRPRPYWLPFEEQIYPPPPAADAIPPPFVIASRSLFERLVRELRPLSCCQYQWDYPVHRGIPLPAARPLARSLERIGAQFGSSETKLGDAFGNRPRFFGARASFIPARQSALLSSRVEAADRRIAALRGPVELLSIAARLVALVVIAGAGFFIVRRRRVEIALLLSRGIGPLTLGLKTALESLLPAVIGVMTGVAAGALTVRALGPSAVWDEDAVREAGGLAVLSLGLGVIVLLLASSGAVQREEQATSERLRRALARMWWEVPLLGATTVLFLRLVRDEPLIVETERGPEINIVVMLLPVVFILGGAGLVTRLLKVGLGRLGRRAARRSAPLFLATRRLASAPQPAVMLVTASAFSIGVLIYAATLSASVEATASAKAKVFVGSDVSALVPADSVPPKGFPFPITRVIKVDQVPIEPGDLSVSMLGVDRATFAEAAFWDASFSDEPLADLLRRLEPRADGTVPIAVAGGPLPGEAAISPFNGDEIPLDVVADVQSSPAQTDRRPLLIADDGALKDVLARVGGSVLGRSEELWVRGDADRVVPALRRATGTVYDTVTVGRTLETPSLASIGWTLAVLQALGGAAGLIALVGLLLYLQARQRAASLSHALTRRMGLARRGYLASATIEVAGMLGVSFVTGALLSLVVTGLNLKQIDLRPSLPPPPLLRFPALILTVAGLCVLIASGWAAWRMRRTAERVNVAELLRT
ncbi:hypothetical protein BH24ACT26_BH24ACT26_22450 [soil metagenome]